MRGSAVPPPQTMSCQPCGDGITQSPQLYQVLVPRPLYGTFGSSRGIVAVSVSNGLYGALSASQEGHVARRAQPLPDLRCEPPPELNHASAVWAVSHRVAPSALR